MTRRERLIGQLRSSLAPTAIEVTDESHRHAGHAGARPGGETHYHVEIVSARFAGMSRIARHRLVISLPPIKIGTATTIIGVGQQPVNIGLRGRKRVELGQLHLRQIGVGQPPEQLFPVAILPWYVALSMFAATTATVLAALLPARRAARLNPVDVIR